MSYETYRFIVAILGLVMFVYHCIYYKKLVHGKVAFPLYIYIAMYPYDLTLIFPLYDIVIKGILLMGIMKLILIQQKFKFNKYEILFFATVIITSVANAYNLNYELFIPNFINLLFMLVFSFYAFNTIKSSTDMKQILNVFIINSFVLAICAIIEYYLIDQRPKVSLGNPNYYGLYEFIALLCAHYVYEKIKVKLILYTALVGYSIVLSGSNTLYLIVFIQLGFWGISHLKSKIAYKMFGLILVTFISFYMYETISAMNTNTGLMKYFVKADDLTRVYIWNYAWDVFTNNIFEGVGYGNLLVPYNAMEYVTHNDFLRVLGEVGIVGCSIIITYFISQYNRIMKYDHKIILHLSYFYITIIVFSLTHNNMNSLLFWWVISLPLYNNCFDMESK